MKDIKPLPPTEDKNFWDPDGDATMERVNVPEPDINRKHGGFKVIGRDVVCTLCPNNHTIPVSLEKYDVQDGELVKR